ncbi:MAG: class I SAM-dependent methyltransferase [Thermoguttaceae bacterium]|jgi:2-polyprenyl-3-methyl-5-hydroxy-6-metoxy-1,4-benzoquinol methylase
MSQSESPEPSVAVNLGPRDVLGVIQRTYPEERGLAWVITRLRPWICPFEEVLARIPTNSSVLDVGCGIGIMTVLAANLAGAQRCLGVDVSEKAISAARRAKVGGSAVEFNLANEEGWGLEKFDVVLCVDVLHHVPLSKRKEFVAQLCAAARPGGVVLLKEISPRPRWKYLANCLHDLIISRQWVTCTSPETVRAWFEQAHMTIREVTPMHRLWYAHYLVAAEKPAIVQ